MHGARLFAAVSTGALLSVSLALATLPVSAQDRPESILPPGFGTPSGNSGSSSNPPAQPPRQGSGQTPAQTPNAQPGNSQGGNTPVRIPGNNDVPEVELSIPAGSDAGQTPDRPAPSDSAGFDDLDALDEALADLPELEFEVPPAELRSLASVGLIGPDKGGFAPDALGNRSGEYVHALLKGIDAPLVSRWATIMGRRLLASRLDTPSGISGQQFVADRAWLLAKMGEANVARELVQQVDVTRVTKPLYRVALQVYLAAVDPAGACPLVTGGVDEIGTNDWKMMRSICASLAGEQSRADALFSSARRQGTATGIDLLLAEKLLGVSSRRRAVTIEWDEVENFNVWRHGMALSTGAVPPDRYYEESGRQMTSWLATAPSLPARTRAEHGIQAAALGTLSNAALVSLFAEAADNPESTDVVLGHAAALQSAYSANTRAARLKGLAQLLPNGEKPLDDAGYGSLVLASRAAAAIAPDAGLSEDVKGWLIAAMLTSGLDRQALTWQSAVDSGSLGWALVTASAPRLPSAVDEGAIEDFIDDYGGYESQKARLFVAGLAGLGRIDGEATAEFAQSLGTDILKSTTYTKAIESAIEAKQPGTVALFALAALQGQNWATVSPAHFFRLVKGLRLTGHAAEARMLVAEAITRA